MTGHLYLDRRVRDRMTEYLGGRTLSEATAMYISRCDLGDRQQLESRSPSELGWYLEHELDVARSLWDRDALVAHLDLEYVNFDFPGEPYLDPRRTFAVQEPVEQAARSVFVQHGLSPMHLLTGRGHHFVWRVPRRSEAFRELAALGRVGETLTERYASRSRDGDETVDDETARAFSGLGLVMEHVAHHVQARAHPHAAIPVVVTAVEVGPQQRGREAASVDVSEYGDPLDTRIVRIPFSIYRKPLERRWLPQPESLPLLYTIPFVDRPVDVALDLRTDPRRVALLASRTLGEIPDGPEGTSRLVRTYRSSRLARFHDHYHATAQEPPAGEEVSEGLRELPPCVLGFLDAPNDALMKPAVIRHVALSCAALGWHPRQVSGVIRGRYEEDFGWRSYWDVYDAATRADFYTRLFSGLFFTGRDDLVDYNCVSTREKDLCFLPGDVCRLAPLRRKLFELRRRYHE